MNHQLESSANRSSDSRLLSTRVSFYSRSSPSTLTLHLRLFKVHVRPVGKFRIEAKGDDTRRRDDEGEGFELVDPCACRPSRVSDILKISWVRAWWRAGPQSGWPGMPRTSSPPSPSLPPTLGRPSLAHSLRCTHSPPASLTPSSLLSSTALPFRLAANNTRNNSRCSTHLVLLALVPSVHKPVRSCS